MCALKSPYMATFVGICLEPVLLLIELCERGSLFDVLNESESISWDRSFAFALHAVKALEALHSKQVVHRDFKTLNLLVSRNWEVKLADFGLSRFADRRESKSEGAIKTTLIYCAPEIFFGQTYTKYSDVFSLGIVLWEIFDKAFTGEYHIPYSDSGIGNVYQVLGAVAQKGLRPSFLPGFPEKLKDLILSCLAQAPKERRPPADVVSALVEIEEDMKLNQPGLYGQTSKRRTSRTLSAVHNDTHRATKKSILDTMLVKAAIEKSDIPVLQTLLEQPELELDLIWQDPKENNQTALHRAAAKDPKILQLLLDKQALTSADLNNVDSFGYTALHYAALAEDTSSCYMLISKGASTSIANDDGETPFMLASLCGKKRAAMQLISHEKAARNAQSQRTQFPLYMACMKGNAAYLRQRVEELRSLSVKTFGLLPVHLLASCTDIKCLSLVLDDKANLNVLDRLERTPVHYAAAGGNLATLKQLIGLGAQVNVKDINSQSPLHLASKYDHIDALTLLCSVLRTDARDKDKQTPLHVAAASGSYHAVARLIALGAKIDAVDSNKRTPLANAVDARNYRIVKALAKAAANPNASDRQGWTPLHRACFLGLVDVVRLLLLKGADPLKPTKDMKKAIDVTTDPDCLALLKDDVDSPKSPTASSPPSPGSGFGALSSDDNMSLREEIDYSSGSEELPLPVSAQKSCNSHTRIASLIFFFFF
jgi:ankyrin repeat protein